MPKAVAIDEEVLLISVLLLDFGDPEARTKLSILPKIREWSRITFDKIICELWHSIKRPNRDTHVLRVFIGVARSNGSMTLRTSIV